MNSNLFKSVLLRMAAAAALSAAAAGSALADGVVTLQASPATTTLPDGRTVPMWGYTCGDVLAASAPSTGAACTAANGAAQNGVTWQPPLIKVPAGKLTINLVNNLPAALPTSIIVDGQAGGGLGSSRTTAPSPTHALLGTTWPGTVGGIDPAASAITVGAAGAGYNAPPAVTITNSHAGGGAGATAVAYVGNGVVTRVVVGNPGSGYGAGDTLTVSIAPPPCTINGTSCVQATATIDVSVLSNSDGSPTFVPPPQVDRVRSLATEVANGSSASLVWANLRPGTYVLHSGTETSIQHTMGLYAILVVTDAAGPATAYGTTFDTDVAFLLSEIDPEFNDAVNRAVNTAGFDPRAVWNGQPNQCGDVTVHTCYPPIVNYSPLYYLINGSAFDRTNMAPSIYAGPGSSATVGTVLLRFANAGLRMHVPSVVGAPMTLVAEDGNALHGPKRVQDTVLLTAGKTYDVTIAPAAANGAYTAAAYPLFDRQLSLSSGNTRDGGMQAYISVNGGAASGSVGSSSLNTTASASDKTYYCSVGRTLSVTNPALGLLGGATGVSGVVLGAVTPSANSDLSTSTLNLLSNGTFTYASGASGASATACGGSFQYLPNGNAALARTVTIAECDSTSHVAGCGFDGGLKANNVQFVSSIASTYTSTPPGVLAGVTNPGGLALTASGTGVNADGSFSASGPGAAANCSAWDATKGALPAGATCVQLPYTVTNVQGSTSSAFATVAFQPGSGLVVNVVDAVDPTRAITDYRWIIEEDRTFFIDPKCQINSTNPALRPSTCPPLPVESLGYNFHTASMPVVAQGCVGKASCEDQQTVYDPATHSHVPASCDVGNGICRTGATQKTSLLPKDVHLDPAKRYFISILPGDSVNPTIGGPAPQPVDPANPKGPQRPFDIGKDCGPYTGPTGAWEPAGPAAMCGHGMTGSQISRELLAAGNPTLTIKAQETPLPTAKISVLVFQDDNPLNGENDAGGGVDVIAPNEAGLGGFEIKLFDQAGQLGDNTGQITYDEFNQPVSNSLANTIDPITGLDSCPITARGDGLVGMIPTCPKYESDGKTLSPLAGQAVIANLYPGLYEIQAYPAADRIGRGEEWIQTNTLDGGKPHEAFIKPNEPGYFQEFGPGGFHVTIGFANPAIINNRLATYCASPANSGGAGTQACDKKLTVHVTNNHMSRSPDQRTYSSGSYDNYSFTNCYVSIGPADEADFAFAKCDANGTAVFDKIPNGTYKISVFDQWNDIMLDGLVGTVAVSGDTEKEFPVTQWRTNLYTRTFVDTNGDGVSQDPGELGLALVNTNIRYRDGSLAFFNNTDLNGYAAWNEVFPFMNWLVVETSTTRYKTLGVHSVYDGGGPVDCDPQSTICSNIADHLANTDVRVPLPADLRMPGGVYCDDADCTAQNLLSSPATVAAAKGASTGMISPPQPFGTTMAWQGLLGQNTFMEFPVKPYNPGENGGIKGQVVYASTRPFDDPTLLLQLSWEPGVANVKVNLYSETVDASGNTKLQLADSTMSASFDDWAQGFRKDAAGNLVKAADGTSYVPNMNCPGQDASSPFFATLKNSKMWLDTADAGGNKKPLAYQSQFKCYDGWSQLNQAQPAPYDGKYAFPSVNTVGTDGKPASSNCHMATDAEPWGCKVNTAASPADWDYNKPVLMAGKYVVEVVVPPGYELVKEEDKNILLGDVYIAPVTQQFAGFGNVFIMPDQATINASYNQNNPGNLNLTSNLGSVTFPRHEGDTGSIEAYWPCVGAERIVPDLNSLYPQAGQASPFAGAKRRLCDRKEVQLDDQSSSLAKFYVFSSTHIAGHFTGTITNDFASEFDPFSPQFGEKFGPPNLPVGLRDFNGYEVARVYSDQWGIYNGLYYSTWTVNPPNPTGYAPEMSIACMNDPGPILGADGKTMVTDPNYNPAYSNFCYEQPFMPGTTTYMDTPVIPTQSFADGYNLPDSEYPDGTPAVMKVTGDVSGPWVLAAGGNGGVVSSIAVNSGGAGYTGTPTVVINNAGSGGAGAAATAVLSSGVSAVNMATRGAQYASVPAVNFTGGGGSGAAATAYLGVGSWLSQLLPGGGIYISNGGVGSYAGGAPTVTFSAPACAAPSSTSATCRTATGTVTTTGNGTLRRVTGITMTELGRGYTAAPTVAFSGGNAAATATLGVSFVAITAPGTGYTSAPAVAFAGGGQPFLGTALATSAIAGSVVGINVTNGGSNYTSAPTVTFTGGGGSGATAVASITTSGALTITALGDKVVQNPNFSGPNSTGAPYNQKTITRHYGFGSGGTVALVGADGVPHPLTSVIWSDMQITGNVPAGVPLCSASNRSYTGGNATARCGELVITRADNGKQSIDAVTVTIGGTRPWLVTPTGVTNPGGAAVADNGASFGRMGLSPIQLAIDQASPGDLLLVQPGTYKENLIMWKPVRLQGVGAASVTINADAHPAGKMDQWRRQINCVFGLDLQGVPNLGDNQAKYDPTGAYSCPANMFERVDRIPFEAIVGWDASGNGNLAQVLQEPTLMGAYEGAGITVLGRGVRIPTGNTDFWGQNATGGAGAFTDGSRYLTNGNVTAAQATALGYPGTGGNDCAINTAEVDGRDYGTGNFFCNPSRIDGVSIINSSQGGGALFVHGWAQNLEIANTRISGNQGTLAGAINLGNGETPDAFINDGVECGVSPSVTPCPPINTNPIGVTVANGAAIPFQFNTGVRIHHNMLYNNASIGDALFSGTPSGAGAITVSAGADGYRIDHNWIAGNLSTGDGGGVQHLGMAFNGKIDHNFILYNQSTNPTLPTNGGGVAIEGANLDRTLNGNECGSTNDQDCPPGLTEGIGPGLVIDANLIVGNSAESGSGGGLRLQQLNGSADLIAFPTQSNRWYDVTVTNNVIANNVAGYDGGGVSLQDALKVNMVNNTIASNDSTASAGALFKTLGAIMSNTPPPGCTPQTDPSLPQNPNCLVADAPHGPQPAGLVVSAHTVNLTDALVGVATNCAGNDLNGYGYTGAGNASDCRKVSKPHLVNNLFWQNRTFSVNIVDQNGNVVTNNATPTGKGLLSQQNLIALTPQLVQRSTGECAVGANYWDIGLRTDDVNGGTIPATTRLALINSLYTGDARSATIVGSPVSANNQTPAATPLVAPFCNGARMPPEHCTDGGVDNGSPSCKGYNAPAGASETTGLTQVFVFNGIQPTATVDEGHNWLNLSYGPLTLSKPNVGTGTPAEQMLVGGANGLGTTVGAYAIYTGSAAAGNGTVGNGLPATVGADYFGNARTINGNTRVDIGAVALTTGSASVRPMALTFGTVAIGGTSTQTITLQAGGTAVSGLSVSVAAPFAASAAACPATIAAHASCTITVSFTPGAAGPASGSVAVTASAGGPILGAPVALTGNGQVVAVNAAPTTLVFPSIVEGQSGTQSVTLTNLSTAAVTGLAGTVQGTGFTPGASTCPASLGAGASCVISVTYSPALAGSSSGTLALSSNPAVAVAGPVTLIGNASAAVPVLNATTNPATGAQKNTVAVTLSGNWLTGATQVNVSGAGVTVSNVSVVDDHTITATFTIAVNAATGARNVTVTTPGGPSNAATFTVTPLPVAFTAASGSGALNAGTQTLAFGNQNGTVSSTVTVKVGGSVPITFQSASFAAGSDASFTKGADTCSGATVQAGGTCKVTVSFAGAGNSQRAAILQLPYTGDVDSPATLNLTGR